MSPKFQPEKDIPNLAGKVILVTGGNTGLGKETILQLAKHDPANIFLAARTQSKAEAAIADIQEQVPSAKITYLPLDLASFPSISQAAQTFQTQSDRLDILIHNAGIMAVPYALTPQNHEIQFGTNHLGHFLLTRLLLPTLLATSPTPRVIAVSSIAHGLAPPPGIIYSAEQLESYGAWRRYGQSKLANILFARELARRYPEQLTAAAVHPGIIETELYASQKTTNVVVRQIVKVLGKTPVFLTKEDGALNQLWAATMEGVKSGAYYIPVARENGGSYWHARKDGLARELWEWSEAEVRRFGFE
ncbi:MAG: hypothetical protein Q9157_004050 [Trypethelium eluteriae]